MCAVLLMLDGARPNFNSLLVLFGGVFMFLVGAARGPLAADILGCSAQGAIAGDESAQLSNRVSVFLLCSFALGLAALVYFT